MADYAKCRKNTWCKMPEGHPDECYPKPDGMRLLTGKELAVLQGTPPRQFAHAAKPPPEPLSVFLERIDAMMLPDLHVIRQRLVGDKNDVEVQLVDPTRILAADFREWRHRALSAKAVIEKKIAAVNAAIKARNTAMAALRVGLNPDDVDLLYRQTLDLAWRMRRAGAKVEPSDVDLLNAGNSYFDRRAHGLRKGS